MRNMKKIPICLLTLTLFLLSCSNTNNKLKTQKDDELDSLNELRLKKRAFAEDSINNVGDSLLGEFHLGMKEPEYKQAEGGFNKETGGKIKINDFYFEIYMPSFEKGKLVCFTIGGTNVKEKVAGMSGAYLGKDYTQFFLNRYIDRFGYPDKCYDKDFKETTYDDEKTERFVWIFNHRTTALISSKHVYRSSMTEEIQISNMTREHWDNFLKSIFESQKRDKENKEKKDSINEKYSTAI